MSDTRFLLRTLGALDLRDSRGLALHDLLAQPKRLALLVYLASGRHGAMHRRDTLLALFWPESDEARARGALSQALRFLRRSLGSDVVLARGNDELALNTNCMWCDAPAFELALGGERPEEALEIYRGDFLTGFHAATSPGFDDWAASERSRLMDHARRAAWTLAEAEAKRGNAAAACQWARRALTFPPDSEAALRCFLATLDQLGDRSGVMQIYSQFAERLRSECAIEPSPDTEALVAAIRRRTSRVGPVASAEREAVVREAEASVLDTDPAPPSPEHPARLLPRHTPGFGRIARVTVLSAALLTGVGGLVYVRSAARSVPAGIRSIAVMPFEDVSPHGRESYAAEGMTAAMITEMSRLGAFSRVMPRATVMRYRGTSKSSQEIARELGVDALVNGAIQRTGARMRISATLTDGKTGATLWTSEHERDVEDVLSLQGDVALAIARAAGARPTLAARRSLAGRHTVNPSAHDAYLRGVYHLHRSETQRALPELLRAVQLDSGFTAAYARLAEAYVLSGYFAPPGALSAAESYQRGRAAAQKALALDTLEPLAHLALAHTRFYYDPDLVGAEDAVRRALDLDPMLAEAHLQYGWILVAKSRHAEALAAFSRARTLDPGDYSTHHAIGSAYMAADRYPDATRQALRSITLDPKIPAGYSLLAQAYVAQGRYAEGVAAYEKAVGLARQPNHLLLGLLGNAYGRAGRGSDARAVLEQLTARYLEHRASPYSIALTHLGLGRRDSALTWLETGYAERGGALVFLRANPAWKTLHEEPRFLALLARLGLGQGLRKPTGPRMIARHRGPERVSRTMTPPVNPLP